MGDVANVSVPLIAVLLILQLVLPLIKRKDSGDSGNDAILKDRVHRIDRRTEAIDVRVSDLSRAVEGLTEAVRENTRAQYAAKTASERLHAS